MDEKNLDLEDIHMVIDQGQSTNIPSQSKKSSAYFSLSKNQKEGMNQQIKQKSLLVLGKEQSQKRKNSISLLDMKQNDQTQNDQPLGQQRIYTIYWYIPESDIKHEISFNVSIEQSIRELLMVTISEFNNTHFIDDGNTIFELFLPKKKSGKPNEDFPPFDLKALLKGTKQTEFSLKVTEVIQPNLMISDVIDLQEEESKKSIIEAQSKKSNCSESNRYEIMYQQYKINPGTSIDQSDQSVRLKVSEKSSRFQEKRSIYCCFVYDSD